MFVVAIWLSINADRVLIEVECSICSEGRLRNKDAWRGFTRRLFRTKSVMGRPWDDHFGDLGYLPKNYGVQDARFTIHSPNGQYSTTFFQKHIEQSKNPTSQQVLNKHNDLFFRVRLTSTDEFSSIVMSMLMILQTQRLWTVQERLMGRLLTNKLCHSWHNGKYQRQSRAYANKLW